MKRKKYTVRTYPTLKELYETTSYKKAYKFALDFIERTEGAVYIYIFDNETPIEDLKPKRSVSEKEMLKAIYDYIQNKRV